MFGKCLKIYDFKHAICFILLSLLMLLIFIGGCSSSNNAPLTEQYPTIAQHARMNNDDFENFLNAAGAEPLDVNGVKNLTIGAKINTRESTYIVSPVFDLGLMEKDNKLDKQLSSGTETKTELAMTSKKNATSDSSQLITDVKASYGTACFKASAAVHYGQKSQETKSTGNVYIDMSRYTTGAYISLITGFFSGNADFSRYLIGSKLDAAAVKSYVNYTESDVPGGSAKYISDIIISNKGQLSDEDNVYGNIQLLSEMERIFSLLNQQYANSKYASVKDALKQNMKKLKLYISLAIQSFYASHGDAFVSKVKLMNYAYGTGQMMFSSSSGNTETQWGVAVSASYQGATGGGGGSASVQGARQHGWATAVKNTTVTAASFPDGIVDTTGWVTTIYGMLKDESLPITVPALNLPSLAELKLPDPIGPKKDPNKPPDSCFQSMDDWIKYQDMKKKGGAGQDQQQAQEQQKKVDEEGPQKALKPALADHTLYERYKSELAALKVLKNQRNGNAVSSIFGGNIIRVDKMFVSGFELTPYDQVIPQLRPNLEIPDESATLDGYPNVSKLIYIVNMLGDLDNYIRFLSNFTISGVSKQMSDNHKAFYDSFYNDAYDKIAFQLNMGVDISNDLLASFGVAKFGKDGAENASDLYKKVGDIDVYRYILKFLLAPENIKIWRNAPGGYIPLGWNAANNTLSFFNSYYVGEPNLRGSADWAYKIFHDMRPFTEPQYNPLSFYDVSSYTDPKFKTYKSPWYPVFQYGGSLNPLLLFVQTIGGYQLVIGQKYAVMPAPNNRRYVTLPLASMNPKFAVLTLPAEVTGKVRDAENGLNQKCTWDYSISFPNTSPDPARIEKYNVLTLVFDHDYGKQLTSIKNWYYLANPMLPLKDYFDGWKSAGAKNAIQVRSQSEVNLKTKYPNANALILLLPINQKTCGDAAKNGFTYATNFKASDLVGSATFGSSYKMTLFSNNY